MSQLTSLSKPVTPSNTVDLDPNCMLDRGHLLQKVLWPKEYIYGGLCDTCHLCWIQCPSNYTKVAEQDRLARIGTPPDIVVSLDAAVSAKHAAHATNSSSDETSGIEDMGVHTIRSEADTDYLICGVALSKAASLSDPVIVVGNDTDLLFI